MGSNRSGLNPLHSHLFVGFFTTIIFVAITILQEETFQTVYIIRMQIQ